MTLFQDTGGDPRGGRAQLADVLSWYGAVSDAAMGNPAGFAVRKASLAVALSDVAECDAGLRAALYFAGLLHAAGAIGSAAFRKGENLPERLARMERWDVPARGARFCASLEVLPNDTSDMVRWQSECWDGTGYPDQLRWHGIPQSAQLLALADFYLRATDPEEALGAIGLESGRAFGPDHARTFMMWFHRNNGEVSLADVPVDALVESKSPVELLDLMADAIDEHNGVAGRWRRVATLGAGAAELLGLGAAERNAFALACRFFGAGEIARRDDEVEQFDPLARLGIDVRAANAAAAAAFAAGHPALADGAAVVSERSEWFDGTGKPNGLRGGKIRPASGLLAAAIAYESLDRAERIEDAAGTQFDPAVVRALMTSAKAHA
ncbi:MAG TPA: HD domain-containing phosphohydrolase [Candidatus Aquilonibacter sp.]|nr:HD domain-containing phosphohydrolase [Candidatus Aquilonibacter sp.]